MSSDLHSASYAEVAAHDAPPLIVQPHPDKNLLYTGPSPTRPTTAPDVDTKVAVVPTDWAAQPTTETSRSLHIDVARSATDDDDDDDGANANVSGSKKRKARRERERRDRTYHEAKAFWRRFTDSVLHPGPSLLGGVMTVLNLGVFSGLGYTLYAHPHARTNPRFLGLSALGVLALFSAEGLTVERYLLDSSPQGHQRQQDILTLKRNAKDVVLRPPIFGGLLGALNLAVLGALGWFAYDRWDDARVWTRRNMSAAGVGLLAWFGGQGLVVDQYATKEYPLRKERK